MVSSQFVEGRFREWTHKEEGKKNPRMTPNH